MSRFAGMLLAALLFSGMVWSAPESSSGSRVSRAVFSTEQEVAPLIHIQGNQVTVRHQSQGSGQVRGTALRGARTYNFTRDGTYKVDPGQYQHVVYGQVPSGGSIISILRYE